ncbi:MAG: S-methyl-5-thioribose-1-phosphate isomerase [Peptococcaceae bacterium]|jgi:methylthioribose-1-phosphate isomerase|nr:S-methyl-5-thioribose-1-phosphate isomerase [Peptococcaceae bacterium]MDH7525457.1 S-methyl-5-thioribose-1-phosphate isomerase [Peptococcaceae bacterium]
MLKALAYEHGKLLLLDQTLLPFEKRYVTCTTPEETAEAIISMKVRGAPAIGVAAAYGIVLAARMYEGDDRAVLDHRLLKASEILAATRPTAVNLFWAIERMAALREQNPHLSVKELKLLLEKEALNIEKEDLERNKRLAVLGSELIGKKANVLTHCNAGALATAGYGTALGIIRAAWEKGKQVHVFAGETRPLLQGARLTTWELMEDNIPVTLITDSMAGYLMQQGKIDLVVVGADRIAANGDTANKIGTYSLAVLANYHGIPFYVAAPYSTLDMSIKSGAEIPIEERGHNEVKFFGSVQVAPGEANVCNPAFDVTPSRLITAIISDCGIAWPPYTESIKMLYEKEMERRKRI